MSLMRAVTAGRRLARMPHIGGVRRLGMTPESTPPEEWEAAGYEVSQVNGAPKIYSPWNKWFPYEPVPFSPRFGPYIEKCEKDKTYWWCSCGESSTQPFCEAPEGCTNCTNQVFKPLPFVTPYDSTVWFCGSKHSPRKPLFDGTCSLVWADVNPVWCAAVGFAVSFVFGIVSTWAVHP